MGRVRTAELGRYLLGGQLSRQGCVHNHQLPPTRSQIAGSRVRQQPELLRQLQTASSHPGTARQPLPVPLRKQLKDEAKALKASGKKKKPNTQNQAVPGWELTVGIEIHAQLNTARKLFSRAAAPSSTSSASFLGNANPNANVAVFDVAIPGSQPVFQPATLIPAVRAALALDCDVQRTSRFDRKHYFHWDQPSGYQITQYYEPFARDGYIELLARDGIANEDGERVVVGIKQIQMEQDTAKTLAQDGEEHWLDFNRVGVPLIEIITLPQIHHPATAAALVRKVQLLLNAVDACVSGMEAGGLRADVNVSVRQRGDSSDMLGTRTEIKNLSSFKAVEDAIIAERDRQISVLEAGGVVEGETRGWSLGSTDTRRLRGKEGEVDYRYMPDPDLGPVIIGDDLVEHLRSTMGRLPDAEVEDLVQRYGLTSKDATSLMLLDDGGRVQYFYNVLEELERRLCTEEDSPPKHDTSAISSEPTNRHVLLAANWCLHELGRLAAARENGFRGSSDTPNDLGMTPEGNCRVPTTALADILFHLHRRHITASVAKELLWAVFRNDIQDVTAAVERDDLWFQELSDEEYAALADRAVGSEEKVLLEFAKFADRKSKSYPHGKLMFLVGKMMRSGPEARMDPSSAERVLRERMQSMYLPQLKGE